MSDDADNNTCTSKWERWALVEDDGASMLNVDKDIDRLESFRRYVDSRKKVAADRRSARVYWNDSELELEENESFDCIPRRAMLTDVVACRASDLENEFCPSVTSTNRADLRRDSSLRSMAWFLNAIDSVERCIASTSTAVFACPTNSRPAFRRR